MKSTKPSLLTLRQELFNTQFTLGRLRIYSVEASGKFVVELVLRISEDDADFLQLKILPLLNNLIVAKAFSHASYRISTCRVSTTFIGWDF